MITLTTAQEIGNESEGGTISYKCPEDIGVPCIAVSLQDWFGGVSRLLGRQFASQIEMYEVLALTSEGYYLIGVMRRSRIF